MAEPGSLHPWAESLAPRAAQRDNLRHFTLFGLMLTSTLALFAPSRPSRSIPQRTEVSIVSGIAAPRVSETGASQRWRRSTITLYLDASLDELGGAARTHVMQAFDAWQASQGELPALVFDTRSGAKLRREQDGKSTVLFAPIDIAGHTDDLAITITFSDAVTGEILESDIIVNARYPFAVMEAGSAAEAITASCAGKNAGQCASRYDLPSVLTHEVGHFFGLGEDSNAHSATMFFCTNPCETHKRDLSDEDQRSIRLLYPAGSLDAEDSGASGCGSRVAGG